MKIFAIKCSEDVMYNNYILSKLKDMGFILDCDVFKREEDEFFYVSNSIIKKSNNIDDLKNSNTCDFYNMEDFEKKYPFEVSEGVIFLNNYCEILETKWDQNTGEVLYKLSNPVVWVTSQCLQKCIANEYVEEPIVNFELCKQIYIPKDYEVSCIEDGVIKIKKTITSFPKDIDECYDIMGIVYCEGFGILKNSQDLTVARDAYLKLAGYDPMDISTTRKFEYKLYFSDNEYLSFPTKEMMDVFKTNIFDCIKL